MENKTLSIDLFIKDQSDIEKRQYEILAQLKRIDRSFQRNCIYPHLKNLIKLYRSLNQINNRLKDLREEFPKRIKKIDFVNKKIEHEVIFVPGADVEKVEELIDWALPHIKTKIDEGKSIYEFINESIELEEVGIMPNYIDEGYFFVPDNTSDYLLLFQYEISIYKSPSDQYRSLKTTLLKKLQKGFTELSPNALKLDLIDEYNKLPNPATYSFQTKLYFPFNGAIFPVAKRQLMQQLVN